MPKIGGIHKVNCLNKYRYLVEQNQATLTFTLHLESKKTCDQRECQK